MEDSIHDFLGKVEAVKDREEVKNEIRKSATDKDIIFELLKE
jgi:hypothetical protein